MPPETQGIVVIDGHRTESTWYANTVRVAQYGADFNVIQDAIDYCNAIGGEWTILLYTEVYREGEITHAGVANITIQGMGYDRTTIAPVGAPATGVIVAGGGILTLKDLEVTAPNNTRPALRVTGNVCDCIGCEFNQVGAGGNVIEMVAQTLNLYRCNVLVGAIDLRTNGCTLNIYHSNIYGGINTASAVIHHLWIESCYLHNTSIQSLATGATTCTVTNSTYLDQITNAGTGAFTINGTSVSRINQTGAGTTTVYGGYVWQITRAVGSVIWWLDDTTLKVIPSQTATDRVIQWAVNAADAATGAITILVHAGTYSEGEITPAGTADITITGMGEGRAVIRPTAIPATGTFVSGHTLCLENLTITAYDNSRTAITVNGGTLTLETCFISGITTGDSIAMTNGQVNAYRTRILLGDIDLRTNPCILNMYYCQIVTDPIDTLNNVVHQIWLEHCNLNNQGVASAATGATTLRAYGCSHLGLLANAGTGNWECRLSDIGGVNFTGTGTLTLFGGDLGSITATSASVVWWRDSATILVLPSGTATDTMITYALAAASAAGGKITIRLATGDYAEANMTLVDDVNIVGEGHTAASGSHITITSANPIFTAGAVQCSLRHLRITQAGAGAVFVINDAAGILHTDDIVFGSTGGNAVTMTAGTYSCHNSTSNDGDYNLSAAACTLTLHRASIVSGNIVTAGAFAHVVTLESVNMNGGNITNGATGVNSTTTIEIIKCYDITAFTDASQLGTILIEASVIVAATKTGTSPWTVRIGEFGALTNTNATGEVTVYGGTVLTVACSAGVIRLICCSYRWINRTSTGNIVDQSPWLGDMPWHVEKWSWQAALANSQVATRGTPIDAGSGQVQLEVTDDSADEEAVEALPAAAGALDVSFLPTRTPRCLMQFAHDAFDAHTTAFYGLRHTLGPDIPDITTEECAGFDWNGTKFRAISSDGGGAGVATDLTTPTVDTHVQLEVIVFGGIRVEFYVDGVLVANHSTAAGIPDATLDWQHLLETAGSNGGDVVQATIRNGGCVECPA